MASRRFNGAVVDHAPAPIPVPRELVPPTRQQILTAKSHIVALNAQKKYLQSHIDQLESDLRQLDVTAVAAVVVPGYPLSARVKPGSARPPSKLAS
jgi:hypothetical protein